MLPASIEYRFTLEGESYLLVEYTRGGERRIKSMYGLAIAAAPEILEAIDGANLYAEAVARECLKEAPAVFWEEVVDTQSRNGGSTKRITCERIPRDLWEAFRKEVDLFLGRLVPPLPAAAAPALPDVSAEPVDVAPAEAIPTVFRGRAS